MLMKIRWHGGEGCRDPGAGAADACLGEQVSDQMVVWPAQWMDPLGG